MRSDSTEVNPVAIVSVAMAACSTVYTLFPAVGMLAVEYLALPLAATLVAPAALFVFKRLKPVPRVVAPYAKVAITEENREITDAEIDELKKLLQLQDRPLTNQEVADHLDISKGHASKRVTKLVQAGVAKRQKVGRSVAIQLH